MLSESRLGKTAFFWLQASRRLNGHNCRNSPDIRDFLIQWFSQMAFQECCNRVMVTLKKGKYLTESLKHATSFSLILEAHQHYIFLKNPNKTSLSCPCHWPLNLLTSISDIDGLIHRRAESSQPHHQTRKQYYKSPHN